MIALSSSRTVTNDLPLYLICAVQMLLQLDVSAMMGYTGAIFRQFFGTQSGIFISFGVLLLAFPGV